MQSCKEYRIKPWYFTRLKISQQCRELQYCKSSQIMVHSKELCGVKVYYTHGAFEARLG